MWYSFFKFLIFRPLVTWGYGGRVEGLENFPTTGGAILASNHIGALDSIVIPALVPRPLTFPAKAELFSGKGSFGARVVAWFLKTVNMVPMDRSGGRASVQSLDAIGAVLAEGHVVAIFPEGTRSPDGRLYKGKTGVARMALQYGVPVIPVGVRSTQTVKGIFGMPWAKRPVVTIGDPLDFTKYAADANSKVLRWITDEVQAAIQSLTGQEYADVYAVRVKYGDLQSVGSDQFVRPRPGDGSSPLMSEGSGE